MGNAERASRLIVVSVPHTGTRSLRAKLGCGHYVHVHSPHLMEKVGDKHMVCPLRDPREVWKSWERRHGTGHGSPLELHDRAWLMLVDLHLAHDITYVPMDIPEERDKAMASLGYHDVDWSKRDGHIPQEDMEACVGYTGASIEKDLGWIYDLPMVWRYYDRPGPG